MAFVRSLQKELKEIHRDKESGVTVEVVGDNFRELRGSVPGNRPVPSKLTRLTPVALDRTCRYTL